MRHIASIAAATASVCALGLGLAAFANGSDALGAGSWVLLSPKGGADLKTGTGAVLHVVIHKATAKYYETQLTDDIAAAVPSGKSLTYAFSARSASKNPVHVVIEKRTAPYTHYLDKLVTLTPDWKPYTFTQKFSTASPPGTLAARLQVGQQIGQIDFKDIRVSVVAP